MLPAGSLSVSLRIFEILLNEPVSKPFVPVKIETQDYEWG